MGIERAQEVAGQETRVRRFLRCERGRQKSVNGGMMVRPAARVRTVPSMIKFTSTSLLCAAICTAETLIPGAQTTYRRCEPFLALCFPAAEHDTYSPEHLSRTLPLL